MNLRAIAVRAARTVPDPVADRLRRIGSRSNSRAIGTALDVLRTRGLPEDLETITIGPEDHTRTLRLGRTQSPVIDRLYWRGAAGWRADAARWWPRVCTLSRSAVEIGANLGHLTVLGAEAQPPESRYLAVEPHPAAAKELRSNLALNQLEHVEILETAIPFVANSGANATIALRVAPADRHAVPVSPFIDDERRPRNWAESLDVKASRLGDVLPRPVDAVLIDVGGRELELLATGRDRLLVERPTIFLTVDSVTAADRQFLLELLGAGYLACRPGDGVLVAMDRRELLRSLVRAPRLRSLLLVTGDQLEGLLNLPSTALPGRR